MKCFVFILLCCVILFSLSKDCLAAINHESNLHEDDSQENIFERQTRFIRFAQRINDVMSLLSFQSIHQPKELFDLHVAKNNNWIKEENNVINPASSNEENVHNKRENAEVYNFASASKALIEWAIKPLRTVSNDFNAKINNIIRAAQYVLNDNNDSVEKPLSNNVVAEKNVESKLFEEMYNIDEEIAGINEILNNEESIMQNKPQQQVFSNLAMNKKCEMIPSIDSFFAEEERKHVNFLNDNYYDDDDGAMFVLADDEEYDASIISPITNRTFSCNCGFLIVSSTIRYSCGGFLRNISVYEYMELSPWRQHSCEILVDTSDPEIMNSNNDSNLISCLCGVDYYAYVSLSDNVVKCNARNLTLHPYLSTPFTPCAGINGANKEASDFCITTSRSNTINLPVVWNYRWRTDAEIKAALIGDGELMVLPFDMEIASLQTWVVISSSSNAMDSYNNLQSDITLFNYYYSPRLPNGEVGFSLRRRNRMVGNFEFFTSPISFTNPELIDSRFIVVPKNASSREYEEYVVSHYLNSPEGSTTSTITLPLHEWEDDFINGGEVYVESGVRGEGMINDYTVIRLHISFSDLPQSQKLYNHKQKLMQTYVVLIIFIVVVVVVLVAAVIGDYCLNKGEIPDDLVSRAQHNKEKKRTNTIEEEEEYEEEQKK